MEDQQQEDYSRMVNGNTILLSLEGWIKFVEGFSKGLQTTEKVSSNAVLDCIGEIMEYMTSFRVQITNLFLYCEQILQENETLKQQLSVIKNSTSLLTSNSVIETNDMSKERSIDEQ